MRSLLACLALAAFLACADTTPDEDAADLTADAMAPGDTAAGVETAGGDSATATLVDAAGATLGTIALRSADGGVALGGTLSGLPPGEHGFHVHQTGRCGPDFSAAGEHFAPAANAHGFDAEGGPHAGDLRNLDVGDDGSVTVDQTNDRVSLATGDAALLDADGAALIIHTGPDDYETQPSGGSGDPIACGVIEG